MIRLEASEHPTSLHRVGNSIQQDVDAPDWEERPDYVVSRRQSWLRLTRDPSVPLDTGACSRGMVPAKVLRVVPWVVLFGSCLWSSAPDEAIAVAWEWLRHCWWFRSAFFETLFVPAISVVFYASCVGIEALGHWNMPVAQNAPRPRRTIKHFFHDLFTYCTPLLLLDIATRKRYPGWSPLTEWELPYLGLHLSRALPETPPTALEVLLHPLLAMAMYDGVFYFLHNLFHRVPHLRGVHLYHHDHDSVSWAVTNQLTVVERTTLVLLANECLKLLHAHPLSRVGFIIVFIGALYESHCPFTLPTVLPLGLYTGAPSHVVHHAKGSCNFAPFFSHFDWLFQTREQDRSSWFWDDCLRLSLASASFAKH
jgi:sterol desaturase/sphingolipid hydroxylase (fatty acid hydroxylase superfamily)